MTRWAGLLGACAVLIGVAALLAAVPRTAFTMYDEGVYYYQAVLLTRGQVPYTDYFVPQPPGILLIGAACEWIGSGIAGVRAFNWVCGLVLLAQTFRLTRRVCQGTGIRQAEPFGVALVAATVVFAYQSIHGATNTPAACLEVAASLLILGTNKRRFALAGFVIAFATAVRLPSLIAAPGLLLLIGFADGRSGFLARAAWFLGALGVGCAVIHLTCVVALPGYFDNVVGFQSNRVRTDWSDRAGQIREFLSEPAVILGVPAALWFLRAGPPELRGIAAHGLLSAVCISVAGKTLSVMYYLPVLPLFAACVAVAVVRLAEGVSRLFALVPLVAITVRVPVIVGVILVQLHPNAEHAACVAAVRNAPGDVVLVADGRIAVLAGKRLPADYYATDPNALHLLGREKFHEWFATMLPTVDMVVVTPPLLWWMSRGNVEQLLASGKPVFFDTDATRAEFDAYRP